MTRQAQGPRTLRSTRSRRARRGTVMVIVIWATAIAAVVVAATQVLSWRQVALGREALARVQARWAARAGVERMIAIMEYWTQHPDPDNATGLRDDLEAHCVGDVATGEYAIWHSVDGVETKGPTDEHSKMNLNTITKVQLTNLPDMTPDTADAIIDWRDANDELEGMGAESDYYANRGYKYRPRNANFRSIAELELVAGCRPSLVRGEDWNLNGRLDPNEDDGNRSDPPDKPDGILDAGWSGYLTAYSVSSKVGASGQDKIVLKNAQAQDLQDRLGVDALQASALIQFGKGGNAKLETLLIAPLGSLNAAQSNNPSGGGNQQQGASSGRSSGGRNSSGGNNNNAANIKALDTKQLRAIFQECTTDDFTHPVPGRLNLNTASYEVMKTALGLDPKAAEAIVARRNSKTGGLTSIVDLLDISALTPQTIAGIGGQVDVVSNVFMIASKGRARSTGTEVDLVVVVDRSTVPARILEIREP